MQQLTKDVATYHIIEAAAVTPCIALTTQPLSSIPTTRSLMPSREATGGPRGAGHDDNN